MPSFNKVILCGNLTRDPELRYTPKGTAIARLALATSRKWKSESGEPKEETTFVDVDAFGKQAETLAQYLKKGSPLLLEGRLKLDRWEDKQTGQKRQKLGVVLETFQFLGAKGSEATVQSPQSQVEPAREVHGRPPVDKSDLPPGTRPAGGTVATESGGPSGEDPGDDMPF